MSTLAPDPARRRPTDQADVRRHNAALVLGTVVSDGPLSRARVAAATGLTRATVGSIVDELLGAGSHSMEELTDALTLLGAPRGALRVPVRARILARRRGELDLVGRDDGGP